MNRGLFQKHLAHAFVLETGERDDDQIRSGHLKRKSDGRRFAIIDSIPRVLDEFNQTYADNFSIQWNAFRATQLDSHLGRTYSSDRFWTDTGWHAGDMKGATVLEVGCGAGRFSEVILKTGANLVSFDLSRAVDANWMNNGRSDNFLLFQGDIYQIDFLHDYSFDYVFCFGVLQHTPDPDKALNILIRKIRPGGFLAIDWYLKHPFPNVWSTPKHIWRPITRRMDSELLFRIVKTYIPIWLPIDTAIRTIPFFGRRLLSVIPIPCWNYVKMGLSDNERVEWAIMDTYDALGARYDSPRTIREVRSSLERQPSLCDIDVTRGFNGVAARARAVER